MMLPRSWNTCTAVPIKYSKSTVLGLGQLVFIFYVQYDYIPVFLRDNCLNAFNDFKITADSGLKRETSNL